MHLFVFQAGIAFSVILASAVYAASRRHSGRLRWLVVGLHAAALSWIAGVIALETGRSDGVRELGLGLLLAGSCAIPPSYFAWVAAYARPLMIGRRRALIASTCSPFLFFFLAYLTNDAHQTMVRVDHIDLVRGHPAQWAGSLYWALETCGYLVILAGGALAVWVARTSASPVDRRRAYLALGAMLPPFLTDAAYTFGWLPSEAPLTPTAFAVSALLLAGGISRYRVLGLEPVARRDVIEQLSDGVLLADEEGIVIDANPAAARILRIPRPELTGRSLADSMSGLRATGPGAVLARRIARLPLRGGRVSATIETEDDRFIEVDAGSVGPTASHPAGRFLLLRDRTDQQRFERLVRRRQKHESVGILAAGVAHEVNNPLAFVRSNLEHVERLGAVVCEHLDAFDESDARDLREMGDVVRQSVDGLDRIAKIVEGLVSFSRIPEGGEAPVDLNEAVDAALQYSALHEISTLDVQVRLEDGVPKVRAARDRLIQVLLNLFLNAKHALSGHNDGVIRVETRRRGTSVEVSVSDSGGGLPESVVEKIFDPFFATPYPADVTGLGLSSAFDIVSDFGGTIEVDSTPGAGSTFTVRLPLA